MIDNGGDNGVLSGQVQPGPPFAQPGCSNEADEGIGVRDASEASFGVVHAGFDCVAGCDPFAQRDALRTVEGGKLVQLRAERPVGEVYGQIQQALAQVAVR